MDYKKILFSNIWVASGNIVGLVIYMWYRNELLWVIPFVLGELFGFVYITKTTEILCERIKKTDLFSIVIGKETVLLFSSLSANVLTYLDRLVLLPLLGGAAVSCYTVAAAFGKSIGILMVPLSSVLLSYYAKKGFHMSGTLFWKINVVTLIGGGGFAVISLFVAPVFTRVLYTSLYNEAKPFLFIANMTGIIGVVACMIQPSVLKFAPTFLQLVIQAVYASHIQ